SQTAMVLAAEGSYDKAQDHLYVLADQVAIPLPAEADSTYIAHRRSLERRLVLLSGILAEQFAFSQNPDQADSLLASQYAAIEGLGFPDSLVPASGVDLNTITADLMKIDNKEVRRWEEYFTGRGRDGFQIWLDRKAANESLIYGILAEHDLPAELIYLSMIESGFSSRAVSSAHAVGPWQFMSATAGDYHLRRSWWVDERRDMEMSTRAAATYIKSLYKRFGDWALVLAAYNTGGGRIARKIREHGHANFWELRLPTQTTAHIPKFIAAARIGENPEKYGFELREIESLRYDILPVNDATDLALVARCAGVSTDQVLALNPGLLRGATPPDLKNYPVRVPLGTGKAAKKELARVPADKRLTWRRHKVERGQTLGAIASTYGTSVSDVAKLNKLQDVHRIRPGDQLLIPMPAELAGKARQRASEKGHYVPPSGYDRVSYKVKSGDTLSGIARKLGVSLTHLRKVNNMHKSSTIHPGERLYAYRPGS
ncbi:MAG: membrane-bound lytic murein transglycosylase D, partial [Candidatus Krumholzibacteriia bacterium]